MDPNWNLFDFDANVALQSRSLVTYAQWRAQRSMKRDDVVYLPIYVSTTT